MDNPSEGSGAKGSSRQSLYHPQCSPMIRLMVSGTVCLSTLSSALLALCEFTDAQRGGQVCIIVIICADVFFVSCAGRSLQTCFFGSGCDISFDLLRTNAIQITALAPEAQAIEIAAFLKRRVVISGHSYYVSENRASYMFLLCQSCDSAACFL